jgi:Xaa-Pro aminopeptidase
MSRRLRPERSFLFGDHPPGRIAVVLGALALMLLATAALRPGVVQRLFSVEGAALVGTASFPDAGEGAAPAAEPPAAAVAARAPRADTSERQARDASRERASHKRDRLPVRFHAQNRRAILDALPQDAVAVFFSNPQRTRENDIRHAYRQDSNLQYLTGTTEAASVLLLAPGGLTIEGETVREVLFVPPRTQYSDAWLGPRLGRADAERVLDVEKTLTNERFADVLRESTQERQRRFFHLPLPYGIEEDSELAEQVAAFRGVARLMPNAASPLTRRAVEVMRTVDRAAAFQTFQRQFRERFSADAFQAAFLRDAYRQFTAAASLAEWDDWRADHFGPARADGQTLDRLLAQLRTRKAPDEQRLLHRAAAISAEAQKAALRAVAPGMHEYEIAARAEYVFKKNGAEAPAFPSLVASGPNTSVLQYHDNRRAMQAGDLVVVDLGAEYHGYAADVSRTAPVDGTFSEEQRAIYALVLKAQKAAIRAARVGNNFRDPHQVARRILGEGLVDLGLLDDSNRVGRYFTHPTSHYLGLYTHDVGRGGPLEAGTVLAVEPGLYLPASDDLPERWHDIGVRIEDVVLVTEDGPVVLSKDGPREIGAVEALMRERRSL